MDNSNSLSHTKWNCKYHIVFAPKYRRKVAYGKLKEDIRDILTMLCKRGVKERYGFREPLYDARAWGEIYNPKQEQELEYMDDFYDYLYCSILILEENDHLYMELSNFEAEKDCPDKIKK